MDLIKMSAILGGKRVLGRSLETRMDLIELGSRGLTKDAVLHLAKFTSLPFGQIVGLLPITERTLQRYELKHHLARSVSEHVLQIAEVIARGIDVFEDKDIFMEWMQQANTALSGATPLNLLGSRFGIEMVLDELGRIETGVYS